MLLKNFLSSLPSICSQPKAHTILFYSHMQDEYIEMKNKSLVDTFIQGYPGLEAIQEMIEPYKSSNGTFLLFDGLFSQLLISRLLTFATNFKFLIFFRWSEHDYS